MNCLVLSSYVPPKIHDSTLYVPTFYLFEICEFLTLTFRVVGVTATMVLILQTKIATAKY